jgi:stress-induced morphogen
MNYWNAFGRPFQRLRSSSRTRAICTSSRPALLREAAGHFRVLVIEVKFNGLQHIVRHRLVYDAVSDWMPRRVHALNITAINLDEVGHSSTVQRSPSELPIPRPVSIG